MTATATVPASSLRTLYLARFGFAIVWAALLVLSATVLRTSPGIAPLTAVLLVLYPAVDLAAAVVDRRTAGAGGPATLLVVNMALSLLTAIGLIVAVMAGAAAVLLVWGLWAITAGAVQLAVGIRRLRLGGQWAMILSGGISVLAGAGFVAQAGSGTSVVGIAGYATLGGVFFLVSALRQRRRVLETDGR